MLLRVELSGSDEEAETRAQNGLYALHDGRGLGLHGSVGHGVAIAHLLVDFRRKDVEVVESYFLF